MEALRNFWSAIAPSLGVGGAIGIIITVIVLPFVKGKVTKVSAGFDRALEKHDEKVEEVANAAVERIKDLSFTQSIQPIVDSELQKITEQANGYIKDQVASLKEGNEKVLAVLTALGAFFDDSIIPDSKKKAFAEAIEAAKSPVTEQIISVTELASKPAKKSSRRNEVIR